MEDTQMSKNKYSISRTTHKKDSSTGGVKSILLNIAIDKGTDLANVIYSEWLRPTASDWCKSKLQEQRNRRKSVEPQKEEKADGSEEKDAYNSD